MKIRKEILWGRDFTVIALSCHFIDLHSHKVVQVNPECHLTIHSDQGTAGTKEQIGRPVQLEAESHER